MPRAACACALRADGNTHGSWYAGAKGLPDSQAVILATAFLCRFMARIRFSAVLESPELSSLHIVLMEFVYGVLNSEFFAVAASGLNGGVSHHNHEGYRLLMSVGK
jgi:hypothetical protein